MDHHSLNPSETYSHIHWSNFIYSSFASIHLENKPLGEDACASIKLNLEADMDVNQLPP